MTKRQNGIRAAILAEVAACADPLGITIKGLCEATGFSSTQISAQASDLRRVGRLFFLYHHHDSRFFATAEQRDAAAPAVAAYVQALRIASLERRRLAHRLRQTERRNVEGPARDKYLASQRARYKTHRTPKPPKPQAPPKPKPHQAYRVVASPKQPAKVKRAELPMVIPDHVKVQEIPGCPARSRYEPPPWFKGEFVREFEELTRGQQA